MVTLRCFNHYKYKCLIRLEPSIFFSTSGGIHFWGGESTTSAFLLHSRRLESAVLLSILEHNEHFKDGCQNMAPSPLCLLLCSSWTDWTRLPSGWAPLFNTIMVEGQNKWTAYLGVTILLRKSDMRKEEKVPLSLSLPLELSFYLTVYYKMKTMSQVIIQGVMDSLSIVTPSFTLPCSFCFFFFLQKAIISFTLHISAKLTASVHAQPKRRDNYSVEIEFHFLCSHAVFFFFFSLFGHSGTVILLLFCLRI